MESSSPSDLAARVSRLESSSRRDRTIVLAVIALALATAQAPRPPAPASARSAPIVVNEPGGGSATLTARGLLVRDSSGRTRMFAGVDDGGRPSIDLRDSAGQLRESMYLLNELPVLRQFDKVGKRRAEIRLDSGNDGELLITDANEKLRLALFLTKRSNPELGLYGSDAKLRAYFSTDDDSPFLVMRDKAGSTRLYVGGYTSGKIGIDVRNARNTKLWSAP